MDTTAIERGLERMGLSSYKAQVYATLLDHGALPAVEIARRSSVPRSRIYDVLTDLEQEGYIETFEREDKRHARAAEPSAVVDDLRRVGDSLTETAEQIEDVWERSSLHDHALGLFDGVGSVLTQVESLVREADTSVSVAATPAQYYQLREALARASENGALVRVSVEDIDGTDIDTEQPVTELRSRAIPGPFVAVVDRTHACFAPNERAPVSYGMVVNDSILSFVFHWYYQTCLWSVCERVYRADSEDRAYASLEGFVRDVFPLWRAGSLVPVTVEGCDIDTGEARTERGTLTAIQYPEMELREPSAPSYDDLASHLTLVVENEAGSHRIGGWGAVYEDVEAERIVLHGSEVVLPPSRPKTSTTH